MADMYAISLSLVQASVVLAALSFMWRDNISWRWLEAVIVGTAVGHTTVLSVQKIWDEGLSRLATGDLTLVMSVALGAMLLLRYNVKTRWMSMIPVAVLFGLACGLALRASMEASIVRQMLGLTRVLNNVDNVILLVGVVCVTLYFIFTFGIKGVSKTLMMYPAKVGRYFVMIYMGATYAVYAYSRFVMLQGALLAMLTDPGIYLIPVAGVLIGAGMIKDKMGKAKKSTS